MKHFSDLPGGLNHEDYGVIDVRAKLPHKILKHHETSGLPQLVLHELCHDSAFGLKKAAYFIDNPDFDHLVGVAGFCKNECGHHKKNLWHEPQHFLQDMGQASFHKQIRTVLEKSFKRKHIDTHNVQDIALLGKELGIANPSFFSWDMQHDNHGLLIFEPSKEISVWRHSLLSNIIALLSMCGRR